MSGDTVFLVIQRDECFGEYNSREEAQAQCDFENDDSGDCEDRLRLMETGF
jgi:hypothetical protein